MASMVPVVKTFGLKSAGIDLLSPFDSAFDAAARSNFAGDLGYLLDLKPFMTLITNFNERTIVAFALRWETTAPASKARIHFVEHKYPDALTSLPIRGNEIRHGERRIVARGVELNCGLWSDEPTEPFYLRQFAAYFAHESDIEELVISLDAVILDDGILLGPNESDLAEDFRAYFEAKQTVYRKIVQSLEAGGTLDESFRRIDELVATKPQPDPLNLLSIDLRLAAEDAHRWRARYATESISLFRSAVREMPFAILRDPQPQ